MNGSAFSSYVVVKAETLELSGREFLSSYAVTDRSTKHFCTQCGTPIFNANPHTYPGLSMLYLGALTEGEKLSPGINIFCLSKCSWVDHIAEQQSFQEAPQRGG